MIDEDAIRQRWGAVGSKLDERGQRLFAAVEVRTAGWGGLAIVSKITGLARSTINRGEADLDGEPLPKGQVRRAGGGRRAVCENDPGLVPALERLVEPATLGDPMRPLIWVSKSMEKLAATRGLKPFFDRRNLPPGLRWVRGLEEAIGACKAAIVLVGPRGFGNTQQYERDLALIRQTHDPAFPVVPVILPEATNDRPFNFLQILTWIDFSHVAKVSDAPDELEHLLTAVQGRQTSADAATEAICPYRGLAAFREEDSAFFFGRGTADDPKTPIGQLVHKVREHPFVGWSGSGKSSFVYAGLVPALRRERDRFWNVLSLRPGRDPLRALAAAFNPAPIPYERDCLRQSLSAAHT